MLRTFCCLRLKRDDGAQQLQLRSFLPSVGVVPAGPAAFAAATASVRHTLAVATCAGYGTARPFVAAPTRERA
jgi:hypothetical protein